MPAHPKHPVRNLMSLQTSQLLALVRDECLRRPHGEEAQRGQNNTSGQKDAGHLQAFEVSP